MTARLVILSNRIPTEAEPAGGLVVALHDTLTEIGGLWVGCAPDPVEVPSAGLTQIGDGAYRRATFDITPDEYDGFYLGYSNSVLWPLFHRRSDLIENEARHAQAYLDVNARVAGLIADELRPDDLLWVHDYHFLPLALELRRLGVKNRIGFFLHTPFPSLGDLPALPEKDVFPDWLAAFDLVGLQTERDVSALLELFRADPQAELLLNGRLRRGKAEFLAMSFPIGINADEFTAQAALADQADLLDLRPGQKLLIGVDRLDYSKGLVNRFEAFGAYLDTRKDTDPRATFLQIAPQSRSELDAYRDIRIELETASGRLNGTHAALDWTPIRYICRPVPREQVAGLLRRADVGMVTPLADGMNLVAKEYVAAQNPDDPGVLILSHFAGAAEQMTDALCVNPYDIEEMAQAIQQALVMPLDERKARHAALLAGVRAEDITWWTHNFLTRLTGVHDGSGDHPAQDMAGLG